MCHPICHLFCNPFEGSMPHLIKRGKTYYYDRRIPKALSAFDSREKIRISLHTDSEKEAEERSLNLNNEIETYWKSLVTRGVKHTDKAFHPILETAKLLGFTYKPSHELAQESMAELLNRLKMAGQVQEDSALVEVKLGGANVSSISLSETLEVYWEISNHLIMNKSETQIRKWRNPRTKAMNNLITVCGDKSLKELVREDIIKLRDWWIERIQKNDLKTGSANKDFVHIKGIISAVDEHKKLGLDIGWLFNNITMAEHKKSKRQPFETEFIQNHLLDIDNYRDINEDAKYILYALADTGARPAEIIGLRSEDIILEEEIPHIKIRPYAGRNLKTHYSERDIPLVGSALWAFQHMPNGFPRYRESKAGPDNFSSALSKYLKARKLFPTEDHTIYSLRHSFQDRLTNLGVPDRIQCQLMGHHFKDRIEYGKGADLAKKQEWLLQMCFMVPSN